jgi:hypothetical protein
MAKTQFTPSEAGRLTMRDEVDVEVKAVAWRLGNSLIFDVYRGGKRYPNALTIKEAYVVEGKHNVSLRYALGYSVTRRLIAWGEQRLIDEGVEL